MAKSPERDLLDLLEEIFSVPCISIDSDTSIIDTGNSVPAITFHNVTENEYNTMTLLIREAHSATLPALVGFLLQLLLSHPPFTHRSPELLSGHQSRFFAIWDKVYDAGSSIGDVSGNDDERKMVPQLGLKLLVEFQLSFQRLKEEGFKFVSELLLSCISRLSPETGGSRRSWVVTHGKAVSVLSELLYSVPDAEWLRLDKNFEYTTAVWKCLKIMTSGAAWWGKESTAFEKNLERLSRCFFKLPTASSLLRTALRVDLEPTEIHSTVTVLLAPLERLHGVPVSEKLNAYTPTPFNFPNASSLERHDFSKPYEFANLRVLFAAWINASPVHRGLREFRVPWDISIVLQHADVYERLRLHPASAARISLGYIFNEVQLEGRGFKPSTDMKAMELLKIFITYLHRGHTESSLSSSATHLTVKYGLEPRPEACVILNAEWVLPWMWQRRDTDLDFVMVMTSAWMLALCKDREELTAEHPVFKMLEKNCVAFEVFSEFFKHVFLHDFISNSIDQEATLTRICRLLNITLQVVQLMFALRPQEISQELWSQIIRCFVDSMDREWIPASCWALVCTIFAEIPRLVLAEAFEYAKAVGSMGLFIPVFLREIEVITCHCENHSVVSLPSESLTAQFESLTAMLQFVILALRANSEIYRSFAQKSHFILSMLKYVNPSIGAVCEILVIIGFGTDITPVASIRGNINIPSTRGMTEQVRNHEILNLISRLVGNTFEMSYIICHTANFEWVEAPLCGLASMLSTGWWVKKPFVYFNVFGYIRMVLLQHGAHKWCCLVPVFVHAVAALLKVDAPIRQIVVENRWNLDLVVTMLTRIRNDDVDCGDCGICFREPILRLVTILVERRPKWCRDLLLERGMGRYSILTIEALETMFETQLKRNSTTEQAEEDPRVLADMIIRIASAFPEWEVRTVKMKRRLEKVKAEERGGCVMKGFYAVYRPMQGVSFCLVPN